MNKTNKTGFEAAYEEAFELGCKELLNKDIYQCCDNAQAELINLTDNKFIIKIKFLDKIVSIDLPEFTFSTTSQDTVHIWEKILIIHYLANADTSQLTCHLKTYRQIKSGSVYFPTFEKRSTIPFTNYFSNNPDSLIKAAHLVNGEKDEHGDISIKIMAFPKVPLYYVIHLGDDEFPASGNILFDETIENIFSAEDIAVLCQQIVFKLINLSKNI